QNEIRKLIEDQWSPPASGLRLTRHSGQQRPPIAILDLGEARQELLERLGKIPPLQFGHRLVRHRIQTAVLLRPFEQEACLADSPAAIDDGQTSIFRGREAVQSSELILTVDELHYAEQHNADRHKSPSPASPPTTAAAPLRESSPRRDVGGRSRSAGGEPKHRPGDR